MSYCFKNYSYSHATHTISMSNESNFLLGKQAKNPIILDDVKNKSFNPKFMEVELLSCLIPFSCLVKKFNCINIAGPFNSCGIHLIIFNNSTNTKKTDYQPRSGVKCVGVGVGVPV